MLRNDKKDEAVSLNSARGKEIIELIGTKSPICKDYRGDNGKDAWGIKWHNGYK